MLRANEPPSARKVCDQSFPSSRCIPGGSSAPVLTAEEREADIDTLGGLVMSLTDRVPLRGELVTHSSGIAFEVLDADPRRIKRLRVRNVPDHGTAQKPAAKD